MVCKDNNLKQMLNKKRETKAMEELTKLSEAIQKNIWNTTALKIKEYKTNELYTERLLGNS
jgi:hypothetical protein